MLRTIPKNEEALWHSRAEQLTIVYLTRRDDIRILPGQNGYDVDLLISILEDRQDTGRYFGVITRAFLSEANEKAPVMVMHFPRQGRENTQESPYPVCLFAFNMRNDMGYWKWIQEPVLNRPGGALTANQSQILSLLTDEEVEKMVAMIKGWYNQRGNWSIKEEQNSWFVVDTQNAIVAKADEKAEAMLIAAAPEASSVLYDALPFLKNFAPHDERAERALRWTVKALDDSIGGNSDLIDAAPSLINALQKSIKYISQAAETNDEAKTLQASARQVLRKALG